MNTPSNEQQADLANPSPNHGVSSLLKSKRFYVVMLLFTAQIINYIDRVNLSVAAPLISKEFGWDPATMGLIFSSFLWTYVVCLVPAGWLTDVIGARKLNAWAISIWSTAAMLTGTITGISTMLAARLALGVGEAATNPSGGKVIRDWFPVKERGLVTSIFQCGTLAGPAIGMPFVAWLVVTSGWRMSFVISGALGFIWLIFWLKYFRNPKECSWLPQEERTYILENNASLTGPAAAPQHTPVKGIGTVGRLLAQKTMWGLALAQGCIIYTLYLFLTWLPSYLVQAKNFTLMKAGVFSTLPYVIAVILGIFFGRLSDKILTPENVAQGKRRQMVIIFMLMSSVVLFTALLDNEFAILMLISLSLSSIASALSLNVALTNDMIKDPAIAGTAFGILILGGNSFGLIAPILTGYIVKSTGSFNSAFFLAGAILIIGAFISFSFTRKPITLHKEAA
ncbi:MAG: MFS transporter [Negativicutes bacterium]|nr:MFS transporter [Negativicutes bacterium]